jgi:general secretion pathway protein B
MSYILEALKKSEQERQIGHVPDISVVQEKPPHPASHWPRWVAGALLVNALILGLIAWRPWGVRAVAEREEAAMSAPAAVAPHSGMTGGTDIPQTAEADSPVALSQETAPAPLPEPVTQMPSPAPAPASASAQAVAPFPDEPADSLSPDAPRWDDLPANVRSGLPAPRIDVHVFAREPARRFVLINLRKHKEGDVLDEGATIDAILADGIVLSYQGQRYRVGRP